MTRKEIMNELKEMNVNYRVTEKTEELEKKLENAKKERENKEMKKAEETTTRCKEFEYLINVLNKNNIMIVNETDRRVTTSKAMFCRRKNKVRAYIKMKTYKELENEVTNVTDRNTQYVAYIDINLNDYAENMIKKICL